MWLWELFHLISQCAEKGMERREVVGRREGEYKGGGVVMTHKRLPAYQKGSCNTHSFYEWTHLVSLKTRHCYELQ